MNNYNQESDSKNPTEFYKKGGRQDPNYCNHDFTRLSVTRIICHKCGLGFFDTPFNPFPIDEINKQIDKEVRKNRQHKKLNKDVVNSE